jgi:hypothetical protein
MRCSAIDPASCAASMQRITGRWVLVRPLLRGRLGSVSSDGRSLQNLDPDAQRWAIRHGSGCARCTEQRRGRFRRGVAAVGPEDASAEPPRPTKVRRHFPGSCRSHVRAPFACVPRPVLDNITSDGQT